jgi:hypothetical protein
MDEHQLPATFYIEYATRDDYLELKVKVTSVEDANDHLKIKGSDIDTGKKVTLRSDNICLLEDEFENELEAEEFFEQFATPAEKTKRQNKATTNKPIHARQADMPPLRKPRLAARSGNIFAIFSVFGIATWAIFAWQGTEGILAATLGLSIGAIGGIVALPFWVAEKIRGKRRT